MLNHPKVSLAQTSDGSATFYNAEIGEHYHSKHGALQESRHVFLNSGLKHYLNLKPSKEVKVLEVGFGTGLNFLLSSEFCSNNDINLHYTSIEAYPLTIDQIRATEYQKYVNDATWSGFSNNYEKALVKPVVVDKGICLEIVVEKLENFEWQNLADVIYFDAFAAIHQPEMWTDEALEAVCKYLKTGGIFVTYAITGNLKRSMKSLGFDIEKAPGAPGKREMLRATKLG